MNAQALFLLGLCAVLLWPTPRLLASAQWPSHSPVAGLVLWQAIGLAAGLAAVGAGIVYAFGALGTSLPAAVLAGWRNPSSLEGLGAGRWVALTVSTALGGYLLAVAAATTALTLGARRHHRHLLDLASTALPAGSALSAPAYGRVLESPTPMAYCLPGLRPRLVVTSATLATLTAAELRAVLAHERAHLTQRHDLVVLPFVAWSAALPFLPGTSQARVAVALLIEMLADDAARAKVGAGPLIAALREVGAAVVPHGEFGQVGDHPLRLRLLRLSAPVVAVQPLAWFAALCAVALVVTPTLLLLV